MAELAACAGITRAMFYNRFGSPVEAIKAWLADDSVTKQDLVDAAVACAPVWWS